MISTFSINNIDYVVLNLLGHGKSGYSYLVEDNDHNQFVVKKMHHEPIEYYTFGDKFQAELEAYELLKSIGILMPKLIDHDSNQELIIKEYIAGSTVFDDVRNDLDVSESLMRMFEIYNVCKMHGINIDYFPTNFINKVEGLYYIDYEFNKYMEEWNFENWGINYWSKTSLFIDYLEKLLAK